MDIQAPPCNLAGLNVLVTRPAHQSDALCERIEAAHGRPVRFPTLEILGPADKHRARAELAGAEHAQLLIFVSSNAVHYAYPLLPERLPFDIGIAAVGSATARTLTGIGLDPTLVPERMDSEGLLALPALQVVEGRRVYVLRGNGGRELIADTLRERGADVRQVEVYRRQLPRRQAAVTNLIDNWSRLVEVVTATSGTVLDNLFTLLGEAGVGLLRRTPLVVISPRMVQQAADLGCEHVYLADSARDVDLVAALCRVNEDVV